MVLYRLWLPYIAGPPADQQTVPVPGTIGSCYFIMLEESMLLSTQEYSTKRLLKTKQEFISQLRVELGVFRKECGWLLFGLVWQWVHGVAHNVQYDTTMSPLLIALFIMFPWS